MKYRPTGGAGPPSGINFFKLSCVFIKAPCFFADCVCTIRVKYRPTGGAAPFRVQHFFKMGRVFTKTPKIPILCYNYINVLNSPLWNVSRLPSAQEMVHLYIVHRRSPCKTAVRAILFVIRLATDPPQSYVMPVLCNQWLAFYENNLFL